MQVSNTPNLLPIPASLQLPYLAPNAGTLLACTYSALYILLEPVAGAMVSPLILASAALGNWGLPKYGTTMIYAAIAVHVVSWIAQFVGHGKFEGRAPALFDNLVQALFLAPLFVWLEFLFMLGYRPELKARLDLGVQNEIAKFRANTQRAAMAENAKAK